MQELAGGFFQTPTPHMTVARTKPKRMLKNGPAKAVTARAIGAPWGSSRPSSVFVVSAVSSCGMETKPPNGSQLMTYSMPPFLKPQIFLPKPMENFSTTSFCQTAAEEDGEQDDGDVCDDSHILLCLFG